MTIDATSKITVTAYGFRTKLQQKHARCLSTREMHGFEGRRGARRMEKETEREREIVDFGKLPALPATDTD